MPDQALAALRELTAAVMAEFFGNDTNLSKRLIKATNNDAQLLLMVQPPDDDRVNRPAPAEPADMAVEQLQHIIHREPWATWLRPGGCLESAHCELTDLLSSVIAADRARRAAPARLRHCPTHGQQPPEAWGCPECLRELREELAGLRVPPAEGEVGELVAWIYQQAIHGPDGDEWRRTADLLQEQAAELAMLRGERPHG